MSQSAAHFTTSQAARLIGIHTRTLYQWLAAGWMPEPPRMPRGKVPARLFTQRDIELGLELRRANDPFRGHR